MVTVGEDTDCAAAMGKAPEVAVWVSEVVETVRVSASLTGAGDSLVTPSSSTVTVVLAAMVLLDPRKQTAMLLALPTPQLPREAPPPTVTLLLTRCARSRCWGG